MNEIVKYKNNHSLRVIKLSKIWLIVIIFIILGIVLLCNNIYYKRYYQNRGILIEKNILSVLVETNDVNKILENKKIIINKKSFAYKIEKIKEPIVLNNISYNEILFRIDLDDNLNIINNTINIKILNNKETILKYIYKKMKGIK